MTTHIYFNALEDQSILGLDRNRPEQPNILIYIPRLEEKPENNPRHLGQYVEYNNYQNKLHHATHRQDLEAKSRERLYLQEMDNRMNEHSEDCRSQYDVYKRSENDIYIKYQDMSGGLNSSGDIDRSTQDRNNNSKVIKVTIDNIRTLPPSGKLEILLELPSGLQDDTQNKKASYETDSTHGSSLSSPKRKTCTCRNLAGSLFDGISGSSHLGVPEMRPRAHSDSKLKFKRRSPQEKQHLMKQLSVPLGKMDGQEGRQTDDPVPEINVQDFSERRKYLQTRLEHESEELKKDLIDNADFISQVNHFRKRSNTCPDQLRKSPISMKSRDDNRNARDKKVKALVKQLSLKKPTFVPHNLIKVDE